MPEKKIKNKTLRTQCTPYTTVPVSLLTADQIMVNETGEVFEFSDTTLRVYLYMRNKYCLTLDTPNGMGYFESWESVAANIGKSPDLFKKGKGNRPDKVLEAVGLLVQTKPPSGRSNRKVVKDLFEVQDKITLLNSKSTDYKERKLFERERYLATKKEEVKEDIKSKVEDPFAIKYIDPPDNINEWLDGMGEEFDGIPF